MEAKPVYDLSRLMRALEADGSHLELAAAIRRALDVSSAHRDLQEAELAVRLLRRLTSGQDDTPLADADLTTIVGALLTNAIVLYARATDTAPIDRRPWFGVSKLPEPLRPVHAEVMRLRNKEVAHFGRGQVVDGAPMLDETIVLRPFDTVHPIGHLSSRAHNRAGLVRRAGRLIEAVLGLATDAVNRRHTEVFRAIAALAEAGDPVMVRLRSMPLVDERLLAVEAGTQVVPESPGHARGFSRVAVVEIHDDDDADDVTPDV